MSDTALIPASFDRGATYTANEIRHLFDIPQTTVHGWVTRGLFTPVGKKSRANLYSGHDVVRMVERRSKSRAVRTPSPVLAGALAGALAGSSAPKPAHLHEVTDEEAAAFVTEGHVYWLTGTENGGKPGKNLRFGPVQLPVIQDNTPLGQGMVPKEDPHYTFDSGEAVVLANALNNAEATWIFGPSGSGKTSGIRQIAAMLNWPMFRVNMNGDFSVADFVGTTEVCIDEETGNAVTRFVPGPLLQAMQHGGILLVDEFSATPAHILLVLQAVLERVEDVHAAWAAGETHAQFVNTADGGKVIHAHPRFRILVTDNTNGQGDVTGAFAGTNVMNEATRSRFTQWLHKGFPSPSDWRAMLQKKTGCTADTAKAIVGVATEVNKHSALLGATTVTSSIVINPRDTLAVGRLVGNFGGAVDVAFNVGVVNSMNPGDPDRQFLVDLIKAKLGV